MQTAELRQEDSLAVSPPSRAALAGLAVQQGKVGLLWDEGSVDVYSRVANQSYGLKFRRRLSGDPEIFMHQSACAWKEMNDFDAPDVEYHACHIQD